MYDISKAYLKTLFLNIYQNIIRKISILKVFIINIKL